jgi:hypothetical protein
MKVAWLLCATLFFGVGCSSGEKQDDKPQELKPVQPKLPEATSLDDAEHVGLKDMNAKRLEIANPDRMVLAGDWLWAKLDDGRVAQIDKASLKVKSYAETGYSDLPACLPLGVHQDDIWACAGENQVTRIDAATAEADEPVEMWYLGDQARFPSAGDRLWTIDADGETVAGRTDPSRDAPVKIDLGGICTDVNGAGQVLWLACPTDGRVLAVDTDKRRVVADVQLDEPRQVAVGDEVWVATADGVVSIDPKSYEVTSLFDVSPGLTGAIWATDDTVWVRAEDPFLTQIDAEAHRVVRVIEAPDLPSGGDVVSVGTSVWATAYDDGAVVGLTAR